MKHIISILLMIVLLKGASMNNSFLNSRFRQKNEDKPTQPTKPTVPAWLNTANVTNVGNASNKKWYESVTGKGGGINGPAFTPGSNFTPGSGLTLPTGAQLPTNGQRPQQGDNTPSWLQKVRDRLNQLGTPTGMGGMPMPVSNPYATPMNLQGQKQGRYDPSLVPQGQGGGKFDAQYNTYTAPNGTRYYVTPEGAMMPMGTSLSAVKQSDGTFVSMDLTGAKLSADGSYWEKPDGTKIAAQDVIPGGGDNQANLPQNAISRAAQNYREMTMGLNVLPLWQQQEQPPTSGNGGGRGRGFATNWGWGGGGGGYGGGGGSYPSYSPNWYLGLNSWNYGE